MKNNPPSPRQTALNCLRSWHAGRSFAETLVDRECSRAALPPADRHLVQALVFSVLRNQTWLNHVIGTLRKGKLDVEARLILQLGLSQLFLLGMADHAAVYETVNLASVRLRGLVNAILRNALRREKTILEDREKLPLSIHYSTPAWLVRRWMEQMGPQMTRDLLRWNNTTPRLYVRANPLIENDVCAAQLRKELTRLVEFLGPQLFESRVTLAYEQDEAPYHVQELSRREMFSHMTEGSRAGTKKLLQMLPGLRSEEDSAADFRLMLHQRTKQLKAASETPLRYGWYLPNFTQKCFGCGKCEKACRSGALKLEDMPDGQTRVVITPWKCSECGVCVATCSNGGLDGLKLRQLTTLGPVSVYKCTKSLCKECGKPIAPTCKDGICSVCRIKIRTKKRQEEAVAKAKERQAEREAKRAAEEAAKALAAEVQAESAAAAAETAPAAVVPEVPAAETKMN